MSQASEDKALAYLAEGRIKVIQATPTEALIHAHGSGKDPYDVRYQAGIWTCSCPARKPLCAHVIAAHLISPLRDGDSGNLSQNLDPEIDKILADFWHDSGDVTYSQDPGTQVNLDDLLG